MPVEIPVELQEEFMDIVDSHIRRTLRSAKRKYERRERKNYYQLVLNGQCELLGDVSNSLIGSPDVECDWGFMDSIDNDNLFFALKSLSPKEQKLLELKFYNDYTNEEIAEELGYKVTSVRQMIFKTMSKLRKELV